MTATVDSLRKALRRYASRQKAQVLQRFFKTGPGEYAHGDIFCGVAVPHIRKIAREFVGDGNDLVGDGRDLFLITAARLLKSAVHEERLLALLILIGAYRCASVRGKAAIYRLYLKHTKYINNWDLVDVTAKHIVGVHLFDKDRTPLYRLAVSASLWERRIALLATFYFIERRQFDDTLKIVEMYLCDPHDLIHKACGWMLREIYKRDSALAQRFIRKKCALMPRVMLRYAIERFPDTKRVAYLKGGTRKKARHVRRIKD